MAVASRRSFFTSSPSSGAASVLSSLARLLPGGYLGLWSLQLCLHSSWNRPDLEAPILASMECLHGLQWWLLLPRLSLGVSLHQVSPVLHFWVRRLGRGLGRPSRLSGRFGPVGHPSGSVVSQCQGTASCSAGAFSSSGHLSEVAQ